MDGQDLTSLADRHGTPLYVASAPTLRARCCELTRAFAQYPGGTRVHFSYKANPVAALLQVIHGCGLGAEVAAGHELRLATTLGVPGQDIVFNGPNKATADIAAAINKDVGLVVVDELDELGELERLEAVAAAHDRVVPIALRICPDVRPRGIGVSFLTGTRHDQFGLDLASGEAERGIRCALASPHLRLRGAMAHVGSGIRQTRSFQILIERLLAVQASIARMGGSPDLLDVGGGLGSRTSRPFTTWEMLAYLGLGRLPRTPAPAPPGLFTRYAGTVCESVEAGCRRWGLPLPRLLLEPGRAIASDAQVLLLTVGAVRDRPGLPRVAFADGGAVTVSLMFLSEQHAVLLANRQAPLDKQPTSVFGRLPSPMNTVYRNLPLPHLEPGDVLAVMDAGAYFTSTATNFGGPRPAVALIDGAEVRLVRRRETAEDLLRVELGLHAEAVAASTETGEPSPSAAASCP